MTEKRKKWLDAVEEFRKNVNAVVECPNCSDGLLSITDVAFDELDFNKGGERILKCDKCDKCEVVLYRKPPPNWYSKNSKEN